MAPRGPRSFRWFQRCTAPDPRTVTTASGLLGSPQPDAAEGVPAKPAAACSGEHQTRTARLGMLVEMRGSSALGDAGNATVRTPSALLGALDQQPVCPRLRECTAFTVYPA